LGGCWPGFRGLNPLALRDVKAIKGKR